MAIKGYSIFPKAPALLEPHHQIVSCHIQDNRSGEVLLLCRDAVGAFFSSSWQYTHTHTHIYMYNQVSLTFGISLYQPLILVGTPDGTQYPLEDNESVCWLSRSDVFCVVVQRRKLVMSSSLVCLNWMACEMEGRWPDSWCFGDAASMIYSTVRSIVV